MIKLTLIPLLPLLGFLTNGLIGNRLPRWIVSTIACGLPALSFLVTLILFSGLAATGVAGASTVAGNISITGGDVTADGISLKTHVHGGVQTGSGNTAGPH